MKSDARPHQLITFTGRLRESLPIEYRELSPAALYRARTFQLSGNICDGWSLDAQHFGEKVLSDRQYVPVAAVTHHEEPTGQPLREAVGAVARYRHHDLLEKGLDVAVHEASEGRHRFHGPCESGARHLCCGSRNLDVKANGGTLGTEDGLSDTATAASRYALQLYGGAKADARAKMLVYLLENNLTEAR